MPGPDEIQQAVQPITRFLDKLDSQLTKVVDRLDALPGIYISRTEYEARHQALDIRIKELEAARISEKNWATTEHTRMTERMGDVEQRLLEKVEELAEKIGARQQLTTSQRITIGLASTGWIVAILTAILEHYWH